MSADSRAKLAARQVELMKSLTDDTAMAGFDADRLHVAAMSLQQKRMRTVERSHPCLASALGTTFAELFNEYARKHQIPAQGPTTDARQFIDYMAKAGKLPESMWKSYFFSSGWRKPQTWWHCLKFFCSPAVTAKHPSCPLN